MSSFTSPLIVKVLDEYEFELFRSFTFHINSRYSENSITVPAGFPTDFASIPKAFWSILPPYGKYTKAAVLHDYLYAKHEYAGVENQVIPVTRKEADLIFLRAMEVLEVGRVKRWVMYQAVRGFGGKAWKQRK
jgi:hypothetical protein